MLKNNLYKLFILIFLLFSNCSLLKDFDIRTSNNNEFNRIFNELYDFISMNKDNNQVLFEHINFVRNKIIENKISLAIYDTLESSIFGGMAFMHNPVNVATQSGSNFTT